MVKNQGKKGSASDVITIGVILLVLSVTILISAKISDEFNDKIQSSGAIGSMEGAARARGAVQRVNDHYGGVIDNSFLLLAVGLGIVTIILAMLVVVHPIFFVFYVIILGLLVFVSGVFSNIYQEMAETPALASVAADLVFTSHIMEYLPFIVGVIGFIIAIVMYKTWQDRTQ